MIPQDHAVSFNPTKTHLDTDYKYCIDDSIKLLQMLLTNGFLIILLSKKKEDL